MNVAWAGTLIRALVAGGVRHAVLSPGSRNTPLVIAMDAIAGEPENLKDKPPFTLHTVLDEREAGFFALGLARTSESPVVLSCTSGSAGAHWLPAVMEASESRIPLIAITADRPTELQGFGAPQTIDQSHLLRPYVRRYRDFSEPSADRPLRWLEAAAAQALDAAMGCPAGPVHLNMPFRKPLWTADDTVPPPPKRTRTVLRPTPRIAEYELIELSARISTSPRGVVVAGPMDLAGHQNNSANAPLNIVQVEQIGRLAEALGWPLIAEPASQLRFGGSGAIATADAMLRDPEVAEALAPDFILRFGRVPTSKSVTQWLERYGDERSVLVDPAGAWEDPTWTVDTVVAMEPGEFCKAMLERMHGPVYRLMQERQIDARWLACWKAADEAASAALVTTTEGQLSEGAVARRVAEAVPADGVLHMASSMPIRDLDGFAPAREADIYVASNRGVNGIDGVIATVLGEATGRDWLEKVTGKNTTVLALCGDLSFLHSVSGLALAHTVTTPTVFVVVDNSGGGIFGILPIANHTTFERHFITPQEATIPALCAGYKVPCLPIHTQSELTTTLAEALKTPGVTVLHVQVDRAESLAIRRSAQKSAGLAARAVLS